MYISIRALLAGADNTSLLWRRLRDFIFVRDSEGEPEFRVGNSAVIFKIKRHDKMWKMKCYVRPKRNLRAIYRENFYGQELCVPDAHSRSVDVVLEPWIEGETLDRKVRSAVKIGDRTCLTWLAESFDSLAIDLLGKEWAHGDLKPENIIVNEQGLHLIDFDAMYRPGFEPEQCNELGTIDLQHPARGRRFDKSIDDYSIALISTSLHALAIEPALAERYPLDDRFLIEPRGAVAGTDRALDEIETIFARRGAAAHYRVAQMLRSPHVSLPGLCQMLQAAKFELQPRSIKSHIFCRKGLFGFRDSKGVVIPALFDEAFDFNEGKAEVRLGKIWLEVEAQKGRFVFRKLKK